MGHRGYRQCCFLLGMSNVLPTNMALNHENVRTHTIFYLYFAWMCKNRTDALLLPKQTHTMTRHTCILQWAWISMSLLFIHRGVAYTGNVPFARILGRRLHKGHAPWHKKFSGCAGCAGWVSLALCLSLRMVKLRWAEPPEKPHFGLLQHSL